MRRFAVMLLLAGVVGCGGSNPTPTSAPPSDPSGPTPPATGPATGKLNGQPFTPDKVELEGRKLTFRQGDDLFKASEVAITLAGEGPLTDGAKVTVKPADKWPDWPLVSLAVTTLKNDFPDAKFLDTGVTMTLELGKPAGGKVTGTIRLTLPDGGGELAGAFTAERRRAHDEPPTADDAPFVRGSVTHPPAKGKAKPGGPDFEPAPSLSVGYVELTGKDWLGDRVGGPLPAEGDGPNWWMQSATFKPRVATLSFVKEGARYEFTKLPPGTYLVFAGLTGGPAAWAKVEVKAGDQLTHDFKLEAGKGGMVEVTTPVAFDGEVRLVPSELIPAEDTNHVGGRIATQLDLGGKAEKGKAVAADVPPGKYTLFVVPGTLTPRGTVEVKAGETAKAEIKDVK